jgi:hypothetical protein
MAKERAEIFEASRAVVRGILDEHDPKPGDRYLMHIHRKDAMPKHPHPLPTFEEFQALTENGDRMVVKFNIDDDGPDEPVWENVHLH